MKKVVDTVKTVVVVMVMVAMLAACSYVEHHYTRKDCEIVRVEGTVVTVEDKAGYLWDYEVEGTAPVVGERVDLVMYTNLTDSYIYDDEIVGVR